jgi:hypothetical protein
LENPGLHGGEDNAIDSANAYFEKRRADEDVKNALPPVVAIVPALGTSQDALQKAIDVGVDVREITVRFSVRSPTGHPIARVYAVVDDGPFQGLQSSRPRSTVLVIAESDTLSSAPAMLTLRRPDVDRPPVIKPTLYALVVGISDYQNVAKLGDVTANDADSVAAELRAQEADGTFAKVEVKPLKDAAATLDNLLDGLQWLSDKTQDLSRN